MKIEPENALQYLRKQGLIPDDADGSARSLGGGISNRVVLAETDVGCFVLKQPLPNLATEDDWPADVSRIHNESNAARAYADILSNFEKVHVPEVHFESRDNHVAVFSCASDTAIEWKERLLDGVVNRDVAGMLGQLLGAVHRSAEGDDRLRRRFESRLPFHQLRVDPYHRTVADRHPDVAGAIDREIERMAENARTLVHGDYSPKNVLLSPEDGNRPEIWILDFEVAHWGDPAFDTAFMLNHLFIKSVYNVEQQSAYHDATMAFWKGYRTTGFDDIERETVRELGILMLARVDGKSPVEYVTDEAVAETLRTIGKRAIREDLVTLDAFREVVSVESDDI